MFYVKAEIAEGVTIKAEISDNVFTICPECGEEHSVELSDILKCEHADLYSTAVYCTKCSAARESQGREED